MKSYLDNRLLSVLSESSRDLLLASAKKLDLPVRTRLYWPEEMPQYGYFLTSGIASVVVGMGDGGTAEVSLVGNEGLVGAIHLLGPYAPITECFMQVEGTALRIPLATLRQAFQKYEGIRNRILEYVQQQTLILGQVAACNKLHEAEPRLARWLLMVSDRVHHDTVSITQEFAAQMIGTRRTTINGVLSSMQAKGLLTHGRGTISIANRSLLRKAACDCYPLIESALARLYSGGVSQGRPQDQTSPANHHPPASGKHHHAEPGEGAAPTPNESSS